MTAGTLESHLEINDEIVLKIPIFSIQLQKTEVKTHENETLHISATGWTYMSVHYSFVTTAKSGNGGQECISKACYIGIREDCPRVKMNELCLHINMHSSQKHSVDQIKTGCQKIQK